MCQCCVASVGHSLLCIAALRHSPLTVASQVDYTDTFRLFCTTRLPNPHYTPELSAKVTLVDFTVTMTGLEDQLLGKLILKEKHELEEQRQGLMEEVQSYKKKIKQLEDDLLFRLSNSQVSHTAELNLSLQHSTKCSHMHPQAPVISQPSQTHHLVTILCS